MLFRSFMGYDEFGLCYEMFSPCGRTEYFNDLVIPMLKTWIAHKEGDMDRALVTTSTIRAEDWKRACVQWLTKRVK